LFAILYNASKRILFGAGTVVSMQRYVFDGEATEIGVETRNIAAYIRLPCRTKADYSVGVDIILLFFVR
jgi:hypothetical protein